MYIVSDYCQKQMKNRYVQSVSDKGQAIKKKKTKLIFIDKSDWNEMWVGIYIKKIVLKINFK